jgi:anaerobic magnesium-protoporphyrin IX monomethyl ester cyclase
MKFMLLLKAANFEFIELGVESGNDDVLKRIKKGISLAQVEVAVAMARRHGLKIWCKFILGHLNETRECMSDTVRFISHLNPDLLSMSIMNPIQELQSMEWPERERVVIVYWLTIGNCLTYIQVQF